MIYLVLSKFEEEHERLLRQVLEKLQENKLYGKHSKCEFWLKEVTFLGYIISDGGITVLPNKVEDVVNCKQLESVLEIRSFLGLARY